jgi:uncharacterized membrane protein YkoI
VAPLDQLISKALAKVPGRVYGVEFEGWPEEAHERRGMEHESNERHVHEIQILGKNHKLHGLVYDASSGQFVGEHNEAGEEGGEDRD